MAKRIDGRRLRRCALLPLACLPAAAAAVALAAGCGGASRASAPVRTVVQVQHVQRDRWTYARERFRETCGGCHALADAGTHGRRFDLDNVAIMDPAHARFVIEHGEPGMPPWAGVLSKREFEELVAYVSTVLLHHKGETGWHWQLALRSSGEDWSPTDTRNLEARYANEGSGAPTSASASSSMR